MNKIIETIYQNSNENKNGILQSMTYAQGTLI